MEHEEVGNIKKMIFMIFVCISVMPRSRGYGDVTATHKRKSEIPSRIYAKHQYKQESE